VHHLVETVMPVKTPGCAGPSDDNTLAVDAARELTGVRLWRALDDSARFDRCRIESDGHGIGKNDLHGGPRVTQMVSLRDIGSSAGGRTAGVSQNFGSQSGATLGRLLG
jgi:hypothetical protein